MPDNKQQCIYCSVTSCRHQNKEHGQCSLPDIKVAPTPMAYTGDPADESMCSNYATR